jgi:hypothetical protein
MPHAPTPVVETDWTKTVSTEKGLGVGVYAQFLQLATGGLSIGPEINFENSNKTANTFAFDTVTTLAFEPAQEYADEAVKAPAVQAWLKQPKQKFALTSELFLVTGMKLVKGAKITYSTSQSTTVSGNVGVDVAPLGMTVGPKGHWTSTNDDAMETSRESEFVFAFRAKARSWLLVEEKETTSAFSWRKLTGPTSKALRPFPMWPRPATFTVFPLNDDVTKTLVHLT